MTDEEIRAAALERIKAAVTDFCQKYPDQDLRLMLGMAERTLSVNGYGTTLPPQFGGRPFPAAE